eukprot:Sdes_comp15004_c0_seq1m3760
MDKSCSDFSEALSNSCASIDTSFSQECQPNNVSDRVSQIFHKYRTTSFDANQAKLFETLEIQQKTPQTPLKSSKCEPLSENPPALEALPPLERVIPISSSTATAQNEACGEQEKPLPEISTTESEKMTKNPPPSPQNHMISAPCSDVNQSIVENYQNSAESWIFDGSEEPEEELRKKVDEFGFIQILSDPGLKPSKYCEKWKKQKKKTEKKNPGREIKWDKMLQNWQEFSTNKTKLKKLEMRIYKGIPNSRRNQAWKNILQLKDIIQPNLYQALKSKVAQSPDLFQIDLDIRRTFRDHILYRPRYGSHQKALFWVLSCYSLHNQSVGYCQSMASLAGMLLMYLDEETTFWALHQLFTNAKFDMNDLYTPGLPNLQKMFQIHHRLIAQNLPKIHAHLQKLDIITSSYSSKWFMQIFQDKLPFSSQLRLWDVFLFKGYSVVHAMALLIFKHHQKILLRMDYEEINLFLRDLHRQYFDNDKIMLSLRKFVAIVNNHPPYLHPS